MKNIGWVSIHRQIQDNWVWDDKPFSYGQAWIDLILLANHADKKIVLGKELITVAAGSFITSEYKLADRWGWSKTKVRTFLQLLEKDKMIVKKSDRKKTTLTVVKYELFQLSETTEKLQKNYRKTTEKLLKNSNNNDNNDNNINNNIYAADAALNNTIIDFVEFRKSIDKPMTDRAINLMLNKLGKMTADTNEQIEILNQSIVNGWQGIFPLRKQQQKSKQSKRKEIVPKWANSEQQDYDVNDIEKKILANDPDLAKRADELRKRIEGG